MDGTNYAYFWVMEAGAQSIIKFQSSISGSTAAIDEVQLELLDFIGRNSCQKLVIDLSDTAYLPSSVIGVLAVISSRGVELHLANATPDIVKVMEVMGLHRRIHLNEFELTADSTSSGGSGSELPVAVIKGYVVNCRSCASPVSVDKHLLGKAIACSSCHDQIHINLDLLESASHIYCDCPECDKQLKVTSEWIDATVKCESCGVAVHIRKIR